MRGYLHAALAATIISACGGGGGGGGPTGPGTPTTGTVRGTVVDQTQAPVPGAAVALGATGQTTRNATTNTSGIYSFANVPTGSWTVSVTAPTGYTGTGSANVTVTGGQQANAAAITLTKQAGGGTPAPATANVVMENNAFSPQTVEVRIGGTVTWTNNDAVTHNATGNNNTFTTGNMTNGQARSQRFDAAGTFGYTCTIHPGMNGTVTVR